MISMTHEMEDVSNETWCDVAELKVGLAGSTIFNHHLWMGTSVFVVDRYIHILKISICFAIFVRLAIWGVPKLGVPQN